jgi:serine/threonine-protein kinase
MRKILLRIAGIILAGILFILLFMRLVTGGKEVRVPDVRGKEVTIAREDLDKAGLSLMVLEKRFSIDIPSDHIISQNPRPGLGVKKGKEIKVIVSQGSEKVLVPGVAGKSLRSAGIILRQAGLGIGKITRTYSDLSDADSVMAQSLEAGAEVNKDTEIELLVSLGPYPVYFYMPDLIGRSQEKATEIIEYLGLQLGNLTYEVDPELGEGTVINHSPSFGFPVQAKSLANLEINVKSQRRPASLSRYYMLHYVVPDGLFSKRIEIIIYDAQGSRKVYDTVLPPGKEVDEVLAIRGRARAKIYVDGRLDREMTLR